MLRILLLCCFTAGVFCFPQASEEAFVVSSTVPSTNEAKTEDKAPVLPKIYEMKVFANVSNRFAHTTITNKVKNYGKSSQEATFSVVLPDSAYITGFIMEIAGKNYTAYVKEKVKAKQEYDAAVSSGFGAGLVTANARDSNRFTVSVNIEPESKAVFYLTYEELLKRKQNYEVVINIHPKQPVPNMNVEVYIHETVPLKNVKAAPIRSGNEIRDADEGLDPRATVTNIDANTASVKFSPDPNKQKEYAKILGTKEDDGLSGQFVVQYDVERDSSGGEVLVKDGYFVHFFAPENIKPLPKQVVFVLDTSGSMWGQRIEQLKTAMKSILSELKTGEDLFNLVEFNTHITVWNVHNTSANVNFPKESNVYETTEHPVEDILFPPAVPVNADNIVKANEVVKNFNAEGGTNIYEALKVGIQLVKIQERQNGDKRVQPLIIFLTDGEPTVGVYSTEEITNKISKLNTDIPIFSLSFGDGADKAFLQKLSVRNNGFSRHIYEAADASLQLQDFYKEISSPLLSNVTFKYTQDAKKLTKTTFPNYFGGGEIIICGTIDKFGPDHLPVVSAWSVDGPRDFTPVVQQPPGELERLWAYLTIQQLLEEKENAKNKTENEQKALDIALKYSFVTPLTSLVVVKPNDTKAVNTEAADKPPEEPWRNFAALSAVSRNPVAARPVALAGPPGFSYSINSNYMPVRPPMPSSVGSFEADLHDYEDPMEIMPSISDGVVMKTQSLTTRLMLQTTTMSSIINAAAKNLLKTLSWLSSIYNTHDDSIILPGGNYPLGTNSPINATLLECNNAPNNATGHCTRLHECENIHTTLTTLDIYLQHFCKIEQYAGVCCPN